MRADRGLESLVCLNTCCLQPDLNVTPCLCVLLYSSCSVAFFTRSHTHLMPHRSTEAFQKSTAKRERGGRTADTAWRSTLYKESVSLGSDVTVKRPRQKCQRRAREDSLKHASVDSNAERSKTKSQDVLLKGIMKTVHTSAPCNPRMFRGCFPEILQLKHTV